MANVLAPFGFQQVSGTGSAPTYEQVVLRIQSSNATPIFNGDAVVANNTGYITAATNSGTAVLAGVFIGCKYTSVAQKRTTWSNYWPGSDAAADVEAYVINDPNALFKVQVATTPLTFTAVGRLANIATTTAGNTSTGISGQTLNSTVATTATFPFRVVSVITDPPGSNGSDVTTNNNYVIVAFNNVITKNNSAVTGI